MKQNLTANTLKLIAITAMLLDHIAVCFVATNSIWYFIMRMLGRLTAPIMCYFISEGFYHTKDLARYIRRLALFAVLSHIPYVLCFGFTNRLTTSIMLPLLLGLVSLAVYKNKTLNKYIRYAIILICFIISLPCDWSCMPVFFILLFGMFRENKGEQLLRFGLVATIFAVVSIIDKQTYYTLGILLSIPLLWLYSGELGKKSKLLKWSFYAFYPIHLIILFIIGNLIK